LVAGAPPKVTTASLVNPAPLSVTVAPSTGPAPGATKERVGATTKE
jgi:hypothetical protein